MHFWIAWKILIVLIFSSHCKSFISLRDAEYDYAKFLLPLVETCRKDCSCLSNDFIVMNARLIHDKLLCLNESYPNLGWVPTKRTLEPLTKCLEENRNRKFTTKSPPTIETDTEKNGSSGTYLHFMGICFLDYKSLIFIIYTFQRPQLQQHHKQ